MGKSTAKTEDAPQQPDAPLEAVAPTLYEREWNSCLTMAFSDAGYPTDYLTDWGNVPFYMKQFLMANPDAPDEAVLIHMARSHQVAVLVNEDQRRVQLAVKIFRTYIQGELAIEAEDLEAIRIATAREDYLTAPKPKMDLTDTPFEVEQGGIGEKSDMGKLMDARAVVE